MDKEFKSKIIRIIFEILTLSRLEQSSGFISEICKIDEFSIITTSKFKHSGWKCLNKKKYAEGIQELTKAIHINKQYRLYADLYSAYYNMGKLSEAMHYSDKEIDFRISNICRDIVHYDESMGSADNLTAIGRKKVAGFIREAFKRVSNDLVYSSYYCAKWGYFSAIGEHEKAERYHFKVDEFTEKNRGRKYLIEGDEDDHDYLGVEECEGDET